MAIAIKGKQEMHGMHQVWALSQQFLPFAQRLAHQSDLSVLQVAQATVDDSRGAAGGAGGKIVLLDQQHVASATGALAGDGNAVDASANDDYVEVLSFQRRTLWRGKSHVCRLDAKACRAHLYNLSLLL